MLTELIAKAASRYVTIDVSAKQGRAGGTRWAATVRPHSPTYSTPHLPTFGFDSGGESAEDLRKNLVRMLDLVEPIIAHRERYFAAWIADQKAHHADIKANPVIVTEDGKVHPNMGAH